MPMPRDASQSMRSTASATRRLRAIPLSSRCGRCGPSAPESCWLEFRRALFRKRLDALLDLLTAHALAVTEVGGFLVEFAAGEFVDGALHAAHRYRRVAGQNGSEAVDFLVQCFHRHHSGE